MKHFYLVLIFFTSLLFAQDYQKSWGKVISHESDGKIKSAFSEVNSIYHKAKRSKNESQIIKCFFYKSKYMLVLEEDAQSKIIKSLDEEISKSSAGTKALLNLIYVECLTAYKQKNSNKIYNRSNIDSVILDDFKTWSASEFEKQIDYRMRRTLQDEKTLQNISLEKFEPIFDFLTLDKFKKEALFSYILRENISFFSKKIRRWEITKDDFTAFDSSLLGNDHNFTSLNLDFIKNENLKTVLSIYQKLETHNPSAENQFDRINFCQNFILNNDEAYSKALASIKATDPHLIEKIQFQRALQYSSIASKDLYPNHVIRSVTILDSIILKNSRSNTFKLAILKKKEILKKSLSVDLQKNIYPNQNTRALITHTNINKFKVSLFKINQHCVKQLESKNLKDSITKVITSKKPIKTSEHFIQKSANDYLEHSTEILLPNLEKGTYLICFETDTNDKEEIAFSTEVINVSDFVLFSDSDGRKVTYRVLDRKTGKPIKDVDLTSEYFSLKTNLDGQAVTKINNNHYFDIRISNPTDTLHVSSGYNYNRYNPDDDEEPEAKVLFFLDRGIYRPGQTLYYKGIVIQKTKNHTKTVENLLVKISISDANDDEIKTFDVTTNEFGSFSGEFEIPKNGLTGTYKISATEPDHYEKDPLYDVANDEHPFWDIVDFRTYQSNQDFQVEEYKRPKFEVRFNPIKEDYTVNDLIKVTGIAKAFAGSTISDAKVVYKITRLTISKGNVHNSTEEILKEGETNTDALGNFTVSFIAEPSKNANKKDFPIFSYSINADVTDINGETRSAFTTVKTGFHSLIVSVNVPSQVKPKNTDFISLNSTNLNNEFSAAKGELKIYFIKGFSSKFKTSLWKKPERSEIPESEFERLFPYDKNELAEKKLNEKLVYTKKIDTKNTDKIPLDFIADYQPGYYKAVFSSADKNQNPAVETAHFQIISAGDMSNPEKLISVQQLNQNPKQDGFIKLRITSAVKELYLLINGTQENVLFFENGLHLKNYKYEISIPLRDDLKGNAIIGFESIFENQLFKYQIHIHIADEKSDFTFETETFRDQIAPGNPETWSFKLVSKNNFMDTEVLASMYDYSLNQFATSNWNQLIFDNQYNNVFSNTVTGIQNEKIFIIFPSPYYLEMIFNPEETKLIWFGFDFNNSTNEKKQKEYKRQLSAKAKKPQNSQIISGIVYEGGLPLPGVSVVVKGTTRGTQTDFDGRYDIEAVHNEELVFSYLGFEDETIKINSSHIDINLEASKINLSEVVVVGYGTTTKEAYTGTATRIQTITSDVISSVSQLLKGEVAGVNIIYSGQPGADATIRIRGFGSVNSNRAPLYIIDGVPLDGDGVSDINPQDVHDVVILKDTAATAIYGSRGRNGVVVITTKKTISELTSVKTRTNLQETAFFFPYLKTDSKGKVSFSFTSPEALTQWKFRLYGHTKNAVSGYYENDVVTQKDIMVTPNFPRFFRENDTITISAKVANITKEMKTGNAILQFFDVATGQTIDGKMHNSDNIKKFDLAGFGNSTINWKVIIPEGLRGIQYKIIAKSGNFSDGEESIIPVLTNNILVTETIPVWVSANTKKDFTIENLKTNTSSTLKNHQLTIEYTSNPAWLALQSLPYLIEFEHECAEQTFSRYYANTLASTILNSNPKITTLIDEWRKKGNTSKLEQKEDLKSLLLSETPWATDAKSEEELKQNIALLLDFDKMKNAQELVLKKLSGIQKPSGGFAWFENGNENEYITRHIIAGFGHLKHLSPKEFQSEKIFPMMKKAIAFTDNIFLKKHTNAKTNNYWVKQQDELHYLYARSFYLQQFPITDGHDKFIRISLDQIQQNWISYTLYGKALAALVLNRFERTNFAKKILTSLRETSSLNEESGMYWVENKAGYYWYQSPIETQAILIEAFIEIDDDKKSADAMKVWLLKNKQNKNWPTTKATTEAIYALLLQGSDDWLSVKDNTTITIGSEKIKTSKLSETEKEMEAGYMKLGWKKDEISKSMATISIKNNSDVPAYGGIYWQYFEDLDKIKSHSGNILSVSKELYFPKTVDNERALQRIDSANTLKIGDLITVRLIITAKEDFEYVHLKDMRASCFEPTDVISGYDWKGGLGFYKSTKDAATHFFFDEIKQGTYVLEYTIRVNNIGDFSNGITTIQSMYAPEFLTHTKGIRLSVK